MIKTDDLQAKYRTDGYIVVPGVVDPGTVAGLLGAIAGAVEKIAQALYRKGLVANLFEELPVGRRLYALQEECGKPIGKRGWNPEIFGPALYNLVCAPPVLDVVEKILGPEVHVHGDYWIRPKLPEEERSTIPWHQDSMYYGEDSAQNRILTVWIPLVDVEKQNGCLEVIAGSHTWGLQKAHRESTEHALEPLEDPTKRAPGVVLPMKAGDMIAFSNLTFHRSFMNVTDAIRWSADLRYSPVGDGPEDVFAKFPPMIGRSADAGRIEDFDTWRAKREACSRTREEAATWNNV